MLFSILKNIFSFWLGNFHWIFLDQARFEKANQTVGQWADAYANKDSHFLKINLPYILLADIPPGIAEVNMMIVDGSKNYNSVLFAGHMATNVKEDGVTLQPTLGWAIALKPE